MPKHRVPGNVYAIPFSGVSLSSGASGYDLLSIYTSSMSRVEVRCVEIGQYSTATSLNQQVSIQLLRGTPAGAGTALTPRSRVGWPTAPAPVTSATGMTTTLASTSSATLLYADCSDISGNWSYEPDEGEELTIDAQQGFTVRVSSPGTSVTLAGSMLIKEIGKPGVQTFTSVSTSTSAVDGALLWGGDAFVWGGDSFTWV